MCQVTRIKHKFDAGQGLVEFAIIFPIFLMLVMGIIDFGRILVAYSGASNASREAARFGATDPLNCAAIRNIAVSQVSLIPTDAFSVSIDYDDGQSVWDTCPAPGAVPPTLRTGIDRVRVDVAASISPLTPIISSMFPTFPIRYTAARTILNNKGVPLPVPPVPPPPPPPPAPSVTLNCSPISGGAPLAVVCEATNTGGTVTQWVWDMGAGAGPSSGGTIMNYTFTAVGVYNVVLSAIGPGGTSNATATITVNAGPTAGFDCNPKAFNIASGSVNNSTTCTDSSGNAPTSGTWNWGDGATQAWGGVGTSVQHSFAAKGTYVISLMVTNVGGSSTATQAVNVYNPVAITSFTCTPATGTTPLAVACTGVTTGDMWTADIAWGDAGNSHTFASSGSFTFNVATTQTFTIQLTVTGLGGGSAARSATVTVYPQFILPPVAAFTAAPTYGVAPLTVMITNSTTGAVNIWIWSLGDGQTSIAQDPVSHIYTKTGNFTMVLTATGPGGTSKASPVNITVLPCSGGVLIGNFQGNSSAKWVSWDITNTASVPITITKIALTWLDSNSQWGAWDGAALGGSSIWPGSASSSPATVSSGWTAASRTVPISQTRTLQLNFAKSGSVIAADFNLDVTFDMGRGAQCTP